MAKGSKQKGFVALKHKTKKYNGNVYESFSGSFKVGNRTFVMNINAEGNIPKIVDGEYKGNPTQSVFINWVELYPESANRARTKPNEA